MDRAELRTAKIGPLSYWEAFQSLYVVIHGWQPDEHVSMTNQEIREWVNRNR